MSQQVIFFSLFLEYAEFYFMCCWIKMPWLYWKYKPSLSPVPGAVKPLGYNLGICWVWVLDSPLVGSSWLREEFLKHYMFNCSSLFESHMFQFVLTVWVVCSLNQITVVVFEKTWRPLKWAHSATRGSGVCINHFLCKKTMVCNCCGIWLSVQLWDLWM